jgi:hypothetical protein
MRKKTAEQKIRAFILAGEDDNRVIAEKAKCTRAYVYQIRRRMENEQYSKTQAKLVAMTQQNPRYNPKINTDAVEWEPKITMVEPENESELWPKVVVGVCVLILVIIIVKVGASHV